MIDRCSSTDKIDKIDASGTVHYAQSCTSNEYKISIAFDVTFQEMPRLAKKGTWIWFEGNVTSVTLAKDRRKATVGIAASLVTKVTRAKHKGDDPDAFEEIASY